MHADLFGYSDPRADYEVAVYEDSVPRSVWVRFVDGITEFTAEVVIPAALVALSVTAFSIAFH